MILVKKQRAELAEFKYLTELAEVTEFDIFLSNRWGSRGRP
jgi:hypothetical protein